MKLNSNERSDFIAALSDEFNSLTGYGVFAFIDAYEVNKVFNQYVQANRTLRDFVKDFVKKTFTL